MEVMCLSPEQIRARAYRIYQSRGCWPGHQLDDWLQAEYELLALPTSKLDELEQRAADKDSAQLHGQIHLRSVLRRVRHKSAR